MASLVAYFEPPSEVSKLSTRWGLKPASTERSDENDRIRSAAPISSTIASAVSATTRALRV